MVLILAPLVMTGTAAAQQQEPIAQVTLASGSAASQTVTFRFERGTSYSAVVSGSVTDSYTLDGKDYTTRADGFYDYTRSPSFFDSVHGTDFTHDDISIHGFAKVTKVPAYRSDHTYRLALDDLSGPLKLRLTGAASAPTQGHTYGGAITVTLYAPAGDECADATGPGDDGRICEYRAPWEASLNLRPRGGDVPDDVTRLEIRAKGDLFFDRKPTTGKSADVEPSGRIVLIERYAARPEVHGGKPTAVAIRFQLVNARVRYARESRVLDFDARVAKVAGSGRTSCHKDDSVRITFTQRGGADADEVVLRFYGSPGCWDFTHKGRPLKVTIGRPVKT